MPIFNYKAKEMIVKIVYYGPGLCGKTTSLQHLHQETIPERKGELYFLATETDQTIYFELLPLYAGEIKNFKLRFQVYTVPGQVKYSNTRKAVLQGVDAILFVADSQRTRRKANLLSFEDLNANLKEYNLLLKNVPMVFQYNKRDMENILTAAELSQDLNALGFPYFETIATTGKGVLEAFELVSSLAIKGLEKRLTQMEAQHSPTVFKDVQEKISQSLHLPPRHEDLTVNKPPSSDIQPPKKRGDVHEPPHVPILGKTLELMSAQEKEERNLSYADILAMTYHDGEIIFEEGDPGEEMYFIEAGKVKIVGSYKLTRKVLAIYEKGDFFGEMSLFGGRTRSARAVSVGTTRLLPVTRQTLASQIQSRPEIAIALLETLSSRIRNDTNTIGKLADQNKELTQQLTKAHEMLKQLMEQNKLLKQKLHIGE